MVESLLQSGADESSRLSRANFERVVGEVLLFLSGVPPYEEMFLEELPERIIRPLVLGQFELVRSEEGVIVGYRSWAMVTEELAERLEVGEEAFKLGRDDWNCGGRRIVVDEVGYVQQQ